MSVDLFTYPVLQAADILLYHTDKVPVGDDQRQHLELARDIAQRFNSRYGEILTLPEAAIPGTGGRVMDLQDPTRKMSTTRGTPQGTVLLTDSTDVVTRKIRSAVTDSGPRGAPAGEGKEGIANLIEIMGDRDRPLGRRGRAIVRRRRLRPVQDRRRRGRRGLIGPVRERYLELRADEAHLLDGARRPAPSGRTSIAAPTLAEMKRRMGFV